jgi:hypothetical protein
MDTSYFYTQFATYNTDWLAANVVFWLLLVIATAAVLAKPGYARANMLIKGVLALVFFWNGIVFFMLYMGISAIAGGIPFILAGALLAADVVRNRIRIVLPASGWLRYVTLAWAVWALGVYTVAGWFTGHPYPGGPLPAAPCPTTMLAIALLVTSMGTMKTDRRYFGLLFTLLLWWAFFSGIFAPALYGFYLDLTLLAAGIYGIVMLLASRRNPVRAGDMRNGKISS